MTGMMSNQLTTDIRSMNSRLHKLHEPVPIDWLVFYRVAFGSVMCWYSVRFLTSGAVDLFYTIPLHHFTYEGFHWVKPVDLSFRVGDRIFEFIHLEYACLAISSLMITVGLFYRVSAAVFAICFCHVFLLDKCYYQNHYYLVSLLGLQLPFLPANRAFAVDALLFPNKRSTTTPRWTLWLIRFQIGVPYFFGGVAKIDSDWLRGQPMRMSMSAKTDLPLIGGPWLEQEWVVQCFVWGGLLFDLLIVPALLYPRTRRWAYVFVVLFHLTNATVWTIGIFPWLMILATTVFFTPDWPRRWIGIQNTSQKTESNSPPASWATSLLNIGLATFVAWQCLFPLRHFVYPDRPNWDEYTHHFSWHMLLRAKECGLRIYATDPRNGRSGTVDLRSYVTSRQLGVVARDPRMIHQLCRYISADLHKRGFPGVEIRALALIALNGRKPQPVIDPAVDLGALPYPTGFPEYVLPLNEPFRHTAWKYPLAEWEKHLELDLPSQMQFGVN